jgi:hypothetical protein
MAAGPAVGWEACRRFAAVFGRDGEAVAPTLRQQWPR